MQDSLFCIAGLRVHPSAASAHVTIRMFGRARRARLRIVQRLLIRKRIMNGRATWLAGENAKHSSGPASESSASNRGASKRKITSNNEGGLLSKKLVGVSLL